MGKYFLLIILLSCTIITAAQVHVRDEPRHHNVFENEFIRLLDVYLGPKDTSLYHLHNTPSVFIILANTNVSSQLAGKSPQKGANVAGIISYDSPATPRIHRVWNDDTSWFHVMDVELTAKNQKGKVAVVNNPSLKLLFNEPQVNGYSIDLNPNAKLQLPPSTNGYLLVCQSKSTIESKTNNGTEHRMMKEGHYIWIEANRAFLLQAATRASFVLLQLK